MQIKVYAIDVKVPRWAKRALAFGVIPALLLGVAAVVVAQPPDTFSDNEVLSATKLNGNFSNLQTQINGLSSSVATLQGTVGGSAVPAGTVVAFAGTSVPSGWLLCDGSAVSRTTYAGLFSAIEIAHGGGNGTTTFNLPDYRGRFLRGTDQGSGRDPNSSERAAPQAGNAAVTGGPGYEDDQVGSVQGDAFGEHSHSLRVYSINAGNATAFATGGREQDGQNTLLGANPWQVLAAGGLETRPKNAYVNYIIKY